MVFSRREFIKYSGMFTLATALNFHRESPLSTPLDSTYGLPLRVLAQRIIGPSGKPFKIGIELEWGDMTDPTGIPEQQAAIQFNHRANIWLTMRLSYTGPNQWDFSKADSMVQKCQSLGQSMIGMHLLWGDTAGLPDWILNGGYDRSQLITICQDHINAIMTRYKGKIAAYTVVNEYYPSDMDWFYQQIGPDYYQIAFQLARQADPSAILIFNNQNNEVQNFGIYSNIYYDTTKACVDTLASQGLVDVVGLEMHLFQGRPAKADVISAMQSYGVPVWVNEFDTFQLSAPDLPPNMSAEEEQAHITQNMIEAALESGVCDCFTSWGFNDQHCYWNTLSWGSGKMPCLWDANNNAKMNYYAIQRTLFANMNIGSTTFLPLLAK